MSQTVDIPPRLLLVEDEESIASPIQRGLEEDGYRVQWATDGRRGLREALAGDYDVLVVDWRLPRLDGRSLVQRLRAAGDSTPVLMLTALRDVEHRITGLDAGADDYLAKPFSFEELLARLRALRRRVQSSGGAPPIPETTMRAGCLELDTVRRSASWKEASLDLRGKEISLLELLVRSQGSVVTRSRIAERVWGSLFDVTDNAIDITISTLRAKMKRHCDDGAHIETVRGVGYRLVIDGPETGRGGER